MKSAWIAQGGGFCRYSDDFRLISVAGSQQVKSVNLEANLHFFWAVVLLLLGYGCVLPGLLIDRPSTGRSNQTFSPGGRDSKLADSVLFIIIIIN